MHFVVDVQSGQKYGPADLATLNSWVAEGRVTPQTVLEDAATGQRLAAAQVPGLNFQPAAPQTPPPGTSGPAPGATYGQPGPTPGPQSPYGGGGFQNPPGGYGYMGGDDGSGDITKAYIFSAIGFLCCPLIFSSIAIYHANKAQKKGNPKAQTAMIIAVVSMVGGFIIGAIVNMSMRNMVPSR